VYKTPDERAPAAADKPDGFTKVLKRGKPAAVAKNE
jgi:hypothetical protein